MADTKTQEYSQPQEERIPLCSEADVKEALKEIGSNEQLYSIALFDILGFSNFVESSKTQVVLNLYNKLLELVYGQESTPEGRASRAGAVVPVHTSSDWTSNALIADANGFVQVCHFSDTFVIYVNYQLEKQGWWLRDTKYEPYPLLLLEKNTTYCPLIFEKHHIYLSFLQTCMEFFCQAITMGIPLRGCISTGPAMMDSSKSIYFGAPLVEAARGEPAQNAIGIAFGKSFNNYHPVYNDYFIPYLDHIKRGDPKAKFLSPMVVDWPRYWRRSFNHCERSFSDCIQQMNTDPQFSSYYDNALKFFEFSEKHEDWPNCIMREGVNDILTYYNAVAEWLKTIK